MKCIREFVQLHERENMKFFCFNYMPNLLLLQQFFLIKTLNGNPTQKYLAYWQLELLNEPAIEATKEHSHLNTEHFVLSNGNACEREPLKVISSLTESCNNHVQHRFIQDVHVTLQGLLKKTFNFMGIFLQQFFNLLIAIGFFSLILP